MKLEKRKAPGKEITPAILKHTRKEVTEELVQLPNEIIKYERIPKEWKNELVIVSPPTSLRIKINRIHFNYV